SIRATHAEGAEVIGGLRLDRRRPVGEPPDEDRVLDAADGAELDRLAVREERRPLDAERVVADQGEREAERQHPEDWTPPGGIGKSGYSVIEILKRGRGTTDGSIVR